MIFRKNEIDREEARDVFRAFLLQALDRAAVLFTSRDDTERRELIERAKCLGDRDGRGWTDADLPTLFKALDFQIERLAERHGVKLTDHFPRRPEPPL